MLKKSSIAVAIVLSVALAATGLLAHISPAGWFSAFRGLSMNGGVSHYSIRDLRMLAVFVACGLLLDPSHPLTRAFHLASSAKRKAVRSHRDTDPA